MSPLMNKLALLLVIAASLPSCSYFDEGSPSRESNPQRTEEARKALARCRARFPNGERIQSLAVPLADCKYEASMLFPDDEKVMQLAVYNRQMAGRFQKGEITAVQYGELVEQFRKSLTTCLNPFGCSNLSQ